MITGTIKDYTITTLQNILGILVIQKGTQTSEGFNILYGMTLYTHKLDNLDIHTSGGLHIKSIQTNWQWRYIQQKRREPINTWITYTSQVHHNDTYVNRGIITLNKQTLWEIIMILSE